VFHCCCLSFETHGRHSLVYIHLHRCQIFHVYLYNHHHRPILHPAPKRPQHLLLPSQLDRRYPRTRLSSRPALLVLARRHLRQAYHLHHRHCNCSCLDGWCCCRQELQWVYGCEVLPRIWCQPWRHRWYGRSWGFILRVRKRSKTRSLGFGH